MAKGGREPCGWPEEFPDGAYELAGIDHGDHGFAVPKRAPVIQEEALAVLTGVVGERLRAL